MSIIEQLKNRQISDKRLVTLVNEYAATHKDRDLEFAHNSGLDSYSIGWDHSSWDEAIYDGLINPDDQWLVAEVKYGEIVSFDSTDDPFQLISDSFMNRLCDWISTLDREHVTNHFGLMP